MLTMKCNQCGGPLDVDEYGEHDLGDGLTLEYTVVANGVEDEEGEVPPSKEVHYCPRCLYDILDDEFGEDEDDGQGEPDPVMEPVGAGEV